MTDHTLAALGDGSRSPRLRLLLLVAGLMSGCASHHVTELARVPCPVSLPTDFDPSLTVYTVRASPSDTSSCAVVLLRQAQRCLTYYEVTGGAGGVGLQPTVVACPK